jgi:hypothetical protein
MLNSVLGNCFVFFGRIWVAAAAFAVVGLPSSAQIPPTILDSFPYCSSKSVASEQFGSTGTILLGTGGGIWQLSHAAGPPGIVSDSMLPKPDTGGMTMDIALTPSFAYAAAFRSGLVIFDRTNLTHFPTLKAANTSGAWSVSCLPLSGGYSGHVLVAIGTQEPGTTVPLKPLGRLVIVDHDLGNQTASVLYEHDIGAPVWSVAISSSIAFPGSSGASQFAVLVGLESGQLPSMNEASVQRFDLEYALAPTPSVMPNPLHPTVLGWPDQSGTASQRFVLKVVIDEVSKRAYAAAGAWGVYAFDVSATGAGPQVGLHLDTNSGWPLYVYNNDSPPKPQKGMYSTLSVLYLPGASRARLVIGSGLGLATKSQYYGNTGDKAWRESTLPKPPNLVGDVQGVFEYKLDQLGEPVPDSTGTFPFESAFYTRGDIITPEALSVRAVSSSLFFVDVADDVFGCVVLRGSRSGSDWSLAVDSAWGVGKIPGEPFEDQLIMKQPEKTLYLAIEGALGALDLGVGALPMYQQPLLAQAAGNGGGLYLAGQPNVSGPHGGRVYATSGSGKHSSPGGFTFYNVEDRLHPQNAPDNTQIYELHKGGAGYHLGVFSGLPDPNYSSPHRWLFGTQTDNSQGMLPLDSTIRVWDVGDSTTPVDITSPPPASCSTMGCTVVDPDTLDQGPDYLGTFRASSVAALTNTEISTVAVVTDPSVPPTYQAVYALYGPSAFKWPQAATQQFSTEAGLIILKATVIPGTPSSHVDLQYVGRVPAFDMIPSNDGNDAHKGLYLGSSIYVDETAHRIYGSWSNGGIAWFSFDPLDPVHPLLGRALPLDQIGQYGIPHGPMAIVPGPVGIPSGVQYVYVGFLNEGIAIYSLDFPNSASPQFVEITGSPFPTRWQTAGLILDPDDTRRQTVFTTQARGGVDKLLFSTTLFH